MNNANIDSNYVQYVKLCIILWSLPFKKPKKLSRCFQKHLYTCPDQFGALEYTKKCHSFNVLYGIIRLHLTYTMAYSIIWNIGVTVHMVSSFE